jgi:hypothetical protein
MAISRSSREWMRLPGRLALILGLSALSTAGARADTPEQPQRGAVGDLLIRSEGGKIFLSEGSRDFRELQLRDTAVARRLRQLLENRNRAEGAAHLRPDSTMMASGGGSGFYWWWRPADKADRPVKPENPDKSGTPQNPAAPGKTDATAGAKGQ